MAADRTPATRPNRRWNLLAWGSATAIGLAAGVWFALSRRAPTPPTTPAMPIPVPPSPKATAPKATAPKAAGQPSAPSPAAVSELSRISGLGQRSAEALIGAGILTLRDLASADSTVIAEALDVGGVRRSATLSTWPSQARRLLEA